MELLTKFLSGGFALVAVGFLYSGSKEIRKIENTLKKIRETPLDPQLFEMKKREIILGLREIVFLFINLNRKEKIGIFFLALAWIIALLT